jgi:hypothetical protein
LLVSFRSNGGLEERGFATGGCHSASRYEFCESTF